MTRRLWLGSVLVFLGCATGAPTGGRAELHQSGLRRFAPAGPVRVFPSATRPSPRIAAAGAAAAKSRSEIVATARGLIGNKDVVVGGKKYGADCTALVIAAYRKAGLNLLAQAKPQDNAVTAIFRYAEEHGRVYQGGWPLPGDLVFFRETYDQNRDGRANDGLTHIGIVEGVESDGTVRVVHRVQRGVVVYRMNLDRRDVRVDANGRRLNDYLRSARGERAPALTGQLFAAFATVL